MVLQTKGMTRSITMGTCALIMTFLLAACGGSSAGTGNSTGTTHSASTGNSSQTSKSVQSATAVPTQPTAASTPEAVTAMKTYTGTGFTIEYPQNWKVTTSASEIAFTDPTGSYSLTVGTSANANASVTSDQLVNGGVTGAKSNLKDVETITVPQTETLAGQSWSQRSITGMNLYQGQNTAVQADVLATNYPQHSATTKGYIIAYVALKDKFSAAKTTYFTPMLQTFKFAA